ncbi:hypothetical protein [Neotabrizicola shimadae]|uniref:APCDD1 domain-containing protein n=1 Tax=Neotabrizicola shimadae TaxID=2807096 RepID=A0A8G0ZR90_9RHOB|nr:hypothetical protein [Neotabrizicola shimadae]QYZ68959.1 hypothetical protein JO391_14560 [Neotabrizicola shimadae]
MIRIAPLLLALVLPGAAAAEDTSLSALKSRVTGHWVSVACELRPQQNPTDPTKAPAPSYLKRDFTYDAEGGFTANITVYADPACAVPAVSYDFAGEVVWHDANPAAPGAWSQDYVLNRKLQLTILAEPMAAQLNQLPQGACGDGPFTVGEVRDILGKPCVLLKFVDGSPYVVDHDFLYVREDTPNLLFMGAKHVDGTGFYAPDNRPQVGLQQPLIRVN